MPQRHELIVALEVWEIETGGPAHRVEGRLARPFQPLGKRFEFALARRAVEAADPHIDRMDLASAEQRHDLVAGLLQRQPALHDIAVVARHLDRAGVAEEVGRVQHVDVQRVALDPFAAIEQPPEIAQRPRNGDAERVFHRMHRAHLIGDRADAADARGDVGHLGEGAAAQEGFEEARRLEDAEARRSRTSPSRTTTLQRALALDAGEIIDLDRLTCHGARSPCGTASALALKVR